MPDPLYVKAREILLDALEGLGTQRSSVVLVGAQAIYMHTGDADVAVAPYTIDADLVLDPSRLADRPTLGEALASSGFVEGIQPGEWLKADVRVDLMVPEAISGPGRRGVRLGPHGNRAARKARGLEGALVNNEMLSIESFVSNRSIETLVAGPGALLVSKVHKVAERIGDPGRLKDKDALDVLRILRGVDVVVLGTLLRMLLEDPRSREVTVEALQSLTNLFGRSDAAGAESAARSVEGLDDPAVIAASCAALTAELRAEVRFP